MKLIIFLVLFQGPIGEYLGLKYKKWWSYTGWDSLQSTVPGINDSAWNTLADTQKVIDTFLYQTHPAYSIERFYVSDAYDTTCDTSLAWEESPFLKVKQNLNDTFTIANAYKVPFFIGDTWDMGIVGKYAIGDVDSDGVIDTLQILESVREIIDTQTLQTPIGSLFSYVIQSKIKSIIFLSSMGRFRVHTLSTENFADSVASLFDFETSVGTLFVGPIPIGQVIHKRLREIQDTGTALRVREIKFIKKENNSIKEGIYDILGRKLSSSRFSYGIYFYIQSHNKKLIFKKIFKLRR